MAQKIQIICTRPGMRRHGVEHPDVATYALDRWTEAEIAAFRADPSFHVNLVNDSDGTVTRGAEFDAAVTAEVERLMREKAEQLQASFASTVQAAVAEKVAELQRKLDAANLEIAGTPAKIDAAVKDAMKDIDPALLDKAKELAAENAKLKGKSAKGA